MMDKRYWQKTWAKVQENEGLGDWTIKPNPETDDGLCVSNHKEIWLGVMAGGRRTCALLLHEAAHALTESPPPGHCVEWIITYARLLFQYAPGVGMTPSDLIAFCVQQGYPSGFAEQEANQ